MRIIMFIIVCLCASIVNTTAQNKRIENPNHEDFMWCYYVEVPFLVDEIIDMYKNDTTIIRKYYCSVEKRINDNDCHIGSWYLYDVNAYALKDSLSSRRNVHNRHIIDKMLTKIGCLPPKKPNVDWGLVFLGCEDCNECPFSDYGPGSILCEKASLIYASETDIKQMIAYDNGEQWRYLLLGISGGDLFGGVISNDPIHREIDRRIIKFLIDKWSPCQIPEVQDLVRVLKKVLPQEYKKAWYDAISGTWKGKFGDRVIELTIKANEWTIKGFSKFEGQPDSKRVEFYGENSYSQITGPFVTFTMNELPADKEWNGEFFCRLVRNTDKLEGTWRSNNKKLEREFVLEKVK